MDKLRAIETFIRVVEAGTFVKAAEQLDTSPAAVTRYVADLEERLGTRLLQRTSRKLSMTESGIAYFERCKQILEDLEEADAIASLSAARAIGTLKINVPVSFGILHLAPLWAGFMATHPEVKLDVTLGDRTVDLVEEGYDMAIRIARLPSTNLIARKLAPARMVVCASPDYLKRAGTPRRPEELAQHRCLGYTHWSGKNDWAFQDSDGAEHTVTVNYDLLANNGDTLRAAAVTGAGVVLQPTFIVGADLAAGRLVEVLPDYKSVELGIYALYPSRKHLSAKVRALVDYLVHAFDGTPAWDRF